MPAIGQDVWRSSISVSLAKLYDDLRNEIKKGQPQFIGAVPFVRSIRSGFVTDRDQYLLPLKSGPTPFQGSTTVSSGTTSPGR